MDWKNLIQDLADAGMKQEEIAARCGCKQPSISDLATGKTTNPNYQIADSLRAMHAEMIRRQRRKSKRAA